MAGGACDIHPLYNRRNLRYVDRPLGHDRAAVEAWQNHAMKRLSALAAARFGPQPDCEE
jgi:hypothetical protein